MWAEVRLGRDTTDDTEYEEKVIWAGDLDVLPDEGQYITLDTEANLPGESSYRELLVTKVMFCLREQRVIIGVPESPDYRYEDIPEFVPEMTLTL